MTRRRSDPTFRHLTQLLQTIRRLPLPVQLALLVLLLLGLGLGWWIEQRRSQSESSANPASTFSAKGDILFCHWNFENLFDDQDDPRRQVDEEYDNWFARDAEARQLKYQRLAEALLRISGGRGPDIIAGNEVESHRAVELLRNELNRRLPADVPPYRHMAFVELRDAGRHIAPCVLSRLPLRDARLLGRRQRILEVLVTVDNYNLVLINSHWTSQLSDKGDDPSRGRGAYASVIAERLRHWYRQQPDVDLLVCGDFNTTPDDPLLRERLGLTDRTDLLNQWPPKLFGLLLGKSADRYGTVYYSGKLHDGRHFSGPLIYDQIAVSPGLLDDRAWTCLPDTLQVPTDGLVRSGTRSRQPWRFGGPGDQPFGRGYSDHLPVLLTLRLLTPSP
jgi:endonuclease/exonuclease/phosphatase family metal-dependent hydrolase